MKKELPIYFPKGIYNVKKTTQDNYIFTGKFVSMYGNNSTIYCDSTCDTTTDLFKFVGCVDNYNQFVKGLKFAVANDYANIRYYIVDFC